jgi:hypothetical protein
LIESKTSPAAVFEFYGLRSKGRWGFASIAIDEQGVADKAAGLCAALQQLGGLYAAFGRFLGWRSDLVDAACIASLRQIKIDFPAAPNSTVAAVVRSEFGSAAHDVAAGLGDYPLWNTLARTAYLSQYRGLPVIVEVARDSVPVERFVEFEKGMEELGSPELAAIVSPAVLSQFRQWFRSGESLEREHSYLRVLNQYSGETLAGYPVPIPELCSSAVLCWPAVEGRSVSKLIGQADSRIPALIASAVLEQLYSLSMVEADLDLDAMIVDRDNRLHFRRLSNPVAVPPSLVNNGIRYASAVLAGNASLSAQTLVRLVVSHPPLDLEQRLMDEFSSVDPELKINMWFPPSAGAFESNWRALTKLAAARPLFLDCLHRNLVAVGYWNADAVKSGAARLDAVSDAQWPVIGRLIRTQSGMLMNRDSATEWAIGTGLVMVGALREMNRLTEEIRDNDITVGVELEEPVQRSRPVRRSDGVTLGSLLLILLVSLIWGGSVPEPWPAVLKVLAVGTLPAMFWAVSRMG